jgi:hypothetical protein
MKIVNMTPHPINLNGGPEFPPSGTVARVNAVYEDLNGRDFPSFRRDRGEIINLPSVTEGTVFIVSGLVFDEAVRQGRTDVIAPATDHPDVVRNERGHIVSVPGFVVA